MHFKWSRNRPYSCYLKLILTQHKHKGNATNTNTRISTPVRYQRSKRYHGQTALEAKMSSIVDISSSALPPLFTMTGGMP